MKLGHGPGIAVQRRRGFSKEARHCQHKSANLLFSFFTFYKDILSIKQKGPPKSGDPFCLIR
jgi:hypothetical protein